MNCIKLLVASISAFFFIAGSTLSLGDEPIRLNNMKFCLNFEEGDLPSLHPHVLQGHARGRVLAMLLYEGLTGLDELGGVNLKHAKHVQISDDETVYTIDLHERFWSNGDLITAFDYERGWKQAAAPHVESDYSDLLYVIKNAQNVKNGDVSCDLMGVKAVDDLTLRVELEYPTPYFLKALAQPIFLPLPKEDIQAFNGPFILSNHKKDIRLTLKKNTHFWNQDAIALSNISISFVTDTDRILTMYHQGELDFIGEPISRMSNEAVAYFQKTGDIQHYYPSRFFWVFFNTNQPPFNNLAIRKAFSAALDRELISSSILIGDTPLRAPLPKMLSHTEKLIDDADVQAARDFMREIEYIHPITLSHFLYVSGFTELAVYMQKAWSEAFDIPINLKGDEWNQFFSDLQQGNFQIGGCSFDAHCHDPIEFFNRFAQKDDFNFSKWTTPKFQEKLAQIRHAKGLERDILLKELEEILIDEMPIIPVCTHVHYYVHHKKWTGLTIDPSGCVDFSKIHLSESL